MKLVSWNVAGFRAVLKKGFEEFFDNINADIFCINESKVLEDQFDYRPDGYHMYLNPAERKGYSGVLVFSKKEPINVTYGMGIDEHDHEGRLTTLEYKDFYLVSVYVPNVKRELERLDYRMVWEDDFRKYVKKLEKKKPVVICGDMNVAHEEIDIKNAKANIGNAGFTYEERGKMTELLNSGFIDTYRYYNPEGELYTWWSYLGKAREKDVGWRIDYFLVSKNIINKVTKTYIFRDIMGSDHCPIGIDIDYD